MWHITVRYKHDKPEFAHHFWANDWSAYCSLSNTYNPVGRKPENRQWVIRYEKVEPNDLTPRILEDA